MVLRLVLAMFVLATALLPARAGPGQVIALADALELERLMHVMADEGRRYGDDLDADLLGTRGGSRWTAAVARIHDPERMRGIVLDSLHETLDAHPDAVERMTAFFGSESGKRIIALELSAREALLDEAVEEAAELAHEELRAARDPRLALIERFVEANDLVGANISGALNSNLAFFRGIMAGGGASAGMSEEDLLADLWLQEAQIRTETEEWLYPYLVLAYQPLPDDVLEDYVAFSLTPEGQRLNVALFAAFDALFATLSYDLGAEAARMMQGEDL